MRQLQGQIIHICIGVLWELGYNLGDSKELLGCRKFGTWSRGPQAGQAGSRSDICRSNLVVFSLTYGDKTICFHWLINWLMVSRHGSCSEGCWNPPPLRRHLTA